MHRKPAFGLVSITIDRCRPVVPNASAAEMAFPLTGDR